MRSPLLPALAPALAVGLLLAGCAGSDPTPSARSATTPGAATPGATSTPAVTSTPVARGPVVRLDSTGGDTVVRVLDPAGVRTLGSTTLTGRWQQPTVVPGAAPEGATAAGTVVLTGPSDAARSRFAVLTPPYSSPATVELPGRFGYDAVSPDGRRLYLVEQLPPAGSEHYQVRAYDVPGRALDPTVVVDKTHLDEWMAGRPVSRMTSADGATVATLYRRRGEAPFIHVLNTVDGFALCLDLPASAGPMALAVTALDPATLVVSDPSGVPRFRADLADGSLLDLTAECLDGITRAPLPTWARTGFSDDGAGLPHVPGDQDRIIAALFEYPLHVAADPGDQNKILWIAAPAPDNTAAPSGGSLGMAIDGVLLGTSARISQQVPGGPGPSGVSFPRAGCWSLTLRWSGLTDTLLIPVG